MDAGSEGSGEEFIESLNGTYLENVPYLVQGLYSPEFLTLSKLTDADQIRGAFKAAIFEYTEVRGLYTGFIEQRTSWNILLDAKVVYWFSQSGLPSVAFFGIHNTTFYKVASQRVKMSTDLYMDGFIPKLAEIISTETKLTYLTKNHLIQAILLPFFLISRRHTCKPRGNIIVDFTAANRGFFAPRNNSGESEEE
ncbi:unnamed protein product [Calicophoron daubneyi]|uniref:Uncharacterized protein n=1 Tax=Calicophoron daubneyi TaxID=300641 RepID=A0AAV2TPY9_CALDB